MDLNYIILAHKNPSQLLRLIHRLNGQGVFFYIHIDRNAAIEPFLEKLKEMNNIFFLKGGKREPGVWGDIGIVKGTLNAMTQIIADGRSGYVILLSGQDYPLKSSDYIKSFLSRNTGINFITTFKLPGTWGKSGLDRIHKFKINKSTQRKHFTLLPSVFHKEFYSLKTAGQINYLRKTGQFDLIFKIFKNRKFPKFMEPYGGSQWWALPVSTVRELLNFTLDHPEYLRYHKFTLLADEIFFQSILIYLNKEKQFKFEQSLMYDNWRRPSGPLPVTFTVEDLPELQNAATQKLYARKFDIELDEEILDKIDSFILSL